MRVCIMRWWGRCALSLANPYAAAAPSIGARPERSRSRRSGSQHRATTGVPVTLSESVASSRRTTAWKRPGSAARHPLTRWLAGHQPESIQTQQAPGGRASTQQGTERAGFAPR